MNSPINKTGLFAALAGVISMLALTSPAQNLLTNGGFENEPNWGDDTVYYDGGATALTGNEIPGWTIEPGHAATIHISPGNYLTISGQYSLNTDGEGYDGVNANLYQDFATQSGTNYFFAFKWESWTISNDASPATQLKVSLTDDSTGSNIFTGLYSYDTAYGPVHQVTNSFVGTGNQMRLRIEEYPESGTNDNMFVVDDFGVFSSGNLEVTLAPPCAVTNGAQWQVDGGPWLSSGTVVSNLTIGSSHTIAFSDVTGWVTPSDQTVTIPYPTYSGTASNVVGAYTVPGFITWINLSGIDSNWSTPANWDRNRVPNSGDAVVIPRTGGTNCILNVSATVAGLTIGGCDGTADTLNLNGNTLMVNGPIAVSNNAALTISSGTLNAYGTITIISNGVFTINSGTLVGDDATIIYGTASWSNGTVQGTLTIATNSTLKLTGNNANLLVENCTLTNYGTVLWSSGNPDGGGVPGTVIFNYGLWNCQGDFQFLNDGTGSGTVFNNYGTFSKTVGTNISSTSFASGVIFDQLAGQLDMQQGDLVLLGGGNFLGGTATNNGGTLIFSAGSFILNGTATGTKVFETGGNMVGTTLINGALTWQGGGNWNLAPTATILPGSTLTLNGGANNLSFNNCIVTNKGTVLWTNGYPDGGGSAHGTIIDNYGLWNCQSDYQFKDDGAGSNVVFNNYGTLRKSGGAGELVGNTVFESGVLFNQLSGVIDVQNGTSGLQLAFLGGGNLTGGYVTTNTQGLLNLAGGNFNLNGTVTGTNTWQNACNLSGTNVIRGGLTWVSGTWNPSYFVTIATNSTLVLAGTGTLDFNEVNVTNNGAVVWAKGTLGGGNGSVIVNNNLWDCQSDQQFDGGSGVVFDNYGTLRKSGGAGELVGNTVFESGVLFNQLSGVIDVQNGTSGLQLAFLGGGNLTGGYVTTNTQGLLNLAGGNFNLNGTVTGTNTWQNACNLSGTNVIRGGLTWVSGTWNPSYFVTIATNSTLVLAGTGTLDFNEVNVTNNGTVVWAKGTLGGGNGSVIVNNNLWDCQSDQQFDDTYGGSGVVFDNYGTLRKSGGAGESFNTVFESGVLLNQLSGVIDVQNGTSGLQLAFLGGGNLTGGYVTTNTQGLLNLAGGNFNLNGTVTGTNTWQNACNLSGTNVIRGGLTWVSGTWNQSYFVTIATNSTLVLAGTGTLDFNGVGVTNNGTVVWAKGTLGGGNGSVIVNNNLWDCQSDQVFNDTYGGSGAVFNNSGKFTKTVGTNNGSGTQIQSGITFNNKGQLDCQSGVIKLQGAYSLAGGKLNFGLNSLASYGIVSLAGAAALTGTVSANLNNGFIPTTGNAFPVLTYGSKTGSFTSTVLPLGFTWTTNYGATSYTISVASVLPAGAVTNLAAQWQSGQAALQFSGAPDASYTVLATTNLTVPRTNWIPLGQALQPTSGSFQYLDGESPAYPQRFYQIRSP